jgi:hypothetical protein
MFTTSLNGGKNVYEYVVFTSRQQWELSLDFPKLMGSSKMWAELPVAGVSS